MCGFGEISLFVRESGLLEKEFKEKEYEKNWICDSLVWGDDSGWS